MENVSYPDAAMIVHNMALAATKFGVGACLIWGATMAAKDEDILKQANLPEGFVPCCSIVLGKTDRKYELRDILENKIEKNFIK